MNLSKINLGGALKSAKTVITANSPQLLVGAALVGIVSTGVLAAKGGYKARGIIDEAEAARAQHELNPETGEVDELPGEPLTLTEKVQLTWLCYAAPGVAAASSIAAVVGLHGIHTKRHASMAALYAVSQNKLDDYREKAEELLGSKKAQTLNDHMAQKSVDGDPPNEDYSDVVITGRGNELMQDGFSKRYFLSDVPSVEIAFAKLAGKIESGGDASLNDYYDLIGMEPLNDADIGLRYGWSGTAPQPRFGATNTPDGRSAVVVSFHKEPKDNLGVV